MTKINNKIPTNRYNDKFSSLIRPIKIYLPKHQDHKYDYFVGRERLMERLFNWLYYKTYENGSYLVTGFRGMGKTNLVERVTERLTRKVNQKLEIVGLLLVFVPFIILGYFIVSSADFLESITCENIKCNGWWRFALLWLVIIILAHMACHRWYVIKKWYYSRIYPVQTEYKNENTDETVCDNCLFIFYRWCKKIIRGQSFEKDNVDRIARGKRDDFSSKDFHNIKISINLGHEVLSERDVLSLIATSVRDKYKKFVKSYVPHLVTKTLISYFVLLLVVIFLLFLNSVNSPKDITNTPSFTSASVQGNITASPVFIVSGNPNNSNNNQIIINREKNEKWISRIIDSERVIYNKLKKDAWGRFFLYIFLVVAMWWISKKILSHIPYISIPIHVLRRLDLLVDRLVAVIGEESTLTPSIEKNSLSFSWFSRKHHKIKPIADIREIETELSDIINSIRTSRQNILNKYHLDYGVRFIVVFDEMDKIDPAMMEQPKNNDMPEFTDSVKGFPDGMDSRERRRNVLKLLANIKLFVSTARAKFIFISGRELYDAYQADLSDRDFAISSIFTGVMNVDSFLTPEGGQTDVRSMAEWYIANRLLPDEWLHKKEAEHYDKRNILKLEKPSLKWYYEYLITQTTTDRKDATYVIGFLHIFAAYLTHISNGSPKKIFLYFEKYLRRSIDCIPMNDWNDVCIIGKENKTDKEAQMVLYFDAVQQRTINFVYYLANPIMGTITNDLSNYGDRFLVTLSFIIDHIYKHHSRSFSWRNMEQIPDLLKTSKAPELRDSVTSIMEYLTQIHISSILIGLNEYKFHKSVAEEISVISKFSDEASAIFNFTLDESMSVIAHNTKLLNYYLATLKDKDGNIVLDHRSNIALIHSNLGDLHYWDEDYYAATLEYCAAINTLSPNNAHQNKEERGSNYNSKSDFLTWMRCMLKLGLTYEMRKLYSNAYHIYCNLIEEIIKIRWIDERDFGLSVLDNYIDDWRGKRQILANMTEEESQSPKSVFRQQFIDKLYDSSNDNTNIKYVTTVDGVISSFAKNITPEKTQQVNTLTLFEEIRYVYQSILAKLSILEKMGMSGITQTNIDVAEGEFNAIHKSVNIREKFIISADFFRKFAEILYYKNSLTILSQNQDSFYASVYYGDYDLLARLDDFCMFGECPKGSNALEIKQDVKFFFNWLCNDTEEKQPCFSYKEFRDIHGNKKDVTLKELYDYIRNKLHDYLDVLRENNYSTPLLKSLPKDKDKRDEFVNKLEKNIKSYLLYNIDKVPTNMYEKFLFGSLDYCDYHRRKLRAHNLRPACYACKYYTRSLRVLADNMFDDKEVLYHDKTKSLGILPLSFKHKLLYTNTNNIRTLAQTLEGFGNVMFACASDNKYEKDDYKTKYEINPEIISLLYTIIESNDDSEIKDAIKKIENKLGENRLSRLDKSILYYWDAYRFYIINADYHEAVGCLKKITTIFSYYIQVFCYYSNDEKALGWEKEYETIQLLVCRNNEEEPFLDKLFALVARYTGYKYDHINLTEINELKWIYSKEQSDNIDLTKLSLYPDNRATWLRIAEIKAKGFRYLNKYDKNKYPKSLYLEHIVKTYPLIAPKRRNETTFYEEVLAYYTKVRYNDHILNNLFGGNPLVDHENSNYAEQFHITFYKKLAEYLSSGQDNNRLDSMLFRTSCDVEDRLELIEYLILDTLTCISNMVKVFTPHSHLTSYSKSFIAIIYNYYWEWARKYEFLYSLYQYQEATHNPDPKYKEVAPDDKNEKYDRQEKELDRYSEKKADEILDSIAGGIRINEGTDRTKLKPELRSAMENCSSLISNIVEKKEKRLRYGLRSDRLYQQLRHKIDDITINTIFSNYTAEMALHYYQLSDEANTEGEAYTEMISSLHFLNDDLNNDTCQFNIACDRFLLNMGVVKRQRSRLEQLYKVSQVYALQKAYIDGPNKINNTRTQKTDFKRSDWINSEL